MQSRADSRIRLQPWVIGLVTVAGLLAWVGFLGIDMMRGIDARYRFQLAAWPSYAALVSNYAAAIFIPVLLVLAYGLREPSTDEQSSAHSVWSNVLSIVLGGAIGWTLGVFLVPYDDYDGAIYSKIGAGVTAFLSGFVVSHIPKLVEEQLKVEHRRGFISRICLGAGALLLAGNVVITNRTEYLVYARMERATLQALEAKEKLELDAVRAKYAVEYAALKRKRLNEEVWNTSKAIQYLNPDDNN